MKGEQLQNFVEHSFSRPDQETPTDGQEYFPNIPTLNRLVQLSIGSATDSETRVYCRWALRAWSRQGRIDVSLSCATVSEEGSSENISPEPSDATERKQRKLWAYRQRTMVWANPLKWTRPAFRRKLNECFVDALMNWPPGWTSARTVCVPEAMELWLSRERQLLRCLLGG